ncbi:unnamed protein product [Diatraea saccharalis]|uniref:Gustatory receptor n=1 Tax=Diatraea saccharalis TaxID=40085 RepID=A0A9N9R8N4_9NEOP|nr:unnamed protein product [Diatraea saccharalis]
MEYIFTTLEVSKSLRGLNKLIEELAHLLNMNCSPDNKIKSHYEIKMPNKFLNSMIDSMTTVDTGFTITLPSKTMSDIRRLASMYPEVCEVAKEMDSCHDVGVLLLLLSFLLHLVITPYYLIVKITSSRCLDIAAGVQVLWCGLHLACTFVAAEPSYRTQLEVKRINSLIARMILQSNNGLVLKELKKFSTCLLLNEISHFGFFTGLMNTKAIKDPKNKVLGTSIRKK